MGAHNGTPADAGARERPQRGGKRRNQTGRPRELSDPVTRSVVFERAQLERIGKIVERRRAASGPGARTLTAVVREIIDAGLDAMDTGPA